MKNNILDSKLIVYYSKFYVPLAYIFSLTIIKNNETGSSGLEAIFLIMVSVLVFISAFGNLWSKKENKERLPQMVRILAFSWSLVFITILSVLYLSGVLGKDGEVSQNGINALLFVGPAYLFQLARVVENLDRLSLIYAVGTLCFALYLLFFNQWSTTAVSALYYLFSLIIYYRNEAAKF